ncbi:MAG: acyl-CoA thioesterase [Propionibacteriaceae bacterium]
MFRYEVPIRWSDLDAQQHINNVTYLGYLQEARVALLRDGSSSALLDEGVVVVNHQVEYVRPIAYSLQPVVVETVISKVGAGTFELAYELKHDDAVCARARTTCCPIDAATQKARRLRDDERSHLLAHLAEVAPLRSVITTTVGENAFQHQLRVRWSDQDYFKHVNNVIFLDYFQEARIAMVGHDSGAGYIWFIARHDISYKNPMSFSIPDYVVRSAVAQIGSSSVTMVADIVDATGTVYANSTCVLVCADLVGKPVVVPDSVREKLQQFLTTS